LKIFDHRCLWVWAQLKLNLLSVLLIVYTYFTYSHFQILKYLKILLFEHLRKICVFHMSLLWPTYYCNLSTLLLKLLFYLLTCLLTNYLLIYLFTYMCTRLPTYHYVHLPTYVFYIAKDLINYLLIFTTPLAPNPTYQSFKVRLSSWMMNIGPHM